MLHELSKQKMNLLCKGCTVISPFGDKVHLNDGLIYVEDTPMTWDSFLNYYMETGDIEAASMGVLTLEKRDYLSQVEYYMDTYGYDEDLACRLADYDFFPERYDADDYDG